MLISGETSRIKGGSLQRDHILHGAAGCFVGEMLLFGRDIASSTKHFVRAAHGDHRFFPCRFPCLWESGHGHELATP
jgi:hypothetical protein